jgi:hypothetical protein
MQAELEVAEAELKAARLKMRVLQARAEEERMRGYGEGFDADALLDRRGEVFE